MSISMIGIDHSRASVDIRAKFSFTKKSAEEFMKRLKCCNGISGCIILSTCNRTELWASLRGEEPVSLSALLCEEKGVEPTEYGRYFTERADEEAVEHLFEMASGLKSRILAEDQIITQVKDALALARETYCTDGVLEVLFRMAVTAAKRVKTEVAFSRANPTAIHQAIERLTAQGFSPAGKTCMVIGNGEMGRIAALALKNAGMDVTVTVRQYRSGMVNIPEGCKRINYGDRVSFLKHCDLVVSATASPNFTITKEVVEQADLKESVVMIDLAVPRDIEPEVGELYYVRLYDIDSFKIENSTPKLEADIRQAELILKSQEAEFYNWLSGRDVVSHIQRIKADTVQDMNLRIEKPFKHASLSPSEREMLLEAVDLAAGKVVNKLIFGLKASLDQEAFLTCLAALEDLYPSSDRSEKTKVQ